MTFLKTKIQRMNWKSSLVSILLFILPSIAFSQVNSNVKFGLKFGLHTYEVDKEQLNIFDKDNVEELGLVLENANYGIHGGLMLQINLGAIYLQPELLYNSNTVEFTLKDLTSNSPFEGIKKEKYQYMDIPITMGARLGPLRIGAGPVGHIFLQSTSDLLDLEGYSQDFKSMTLGWQGGIGLDILNAHLDVRYEGNFSNFGDHISWNGNKYEFSQTPSRLIASLGISF